VGGIDTVRPLDVDSILIRTCPAGGWLYLGLDQ